MLFRDNREIVEFAFFFLFLFGALLFFVTLSPSSFFSLVIRKLVVDDAALYQLGNARESRIVTGRD